MAEHRWITVGNTAILFRPVKGGWTTFIYDEDMREILGDEYDKQEKDNDA